MLPIYIACCMITGHLYGPGPPDRQGMVKLPALARTHQRIGTRQADQHDTVTTRILSFPAGWVPTPPVGGRDASRMHYHSRGWEWASEGREWGVDGKRHVSGVCPSVRPYLDREVYSVESSRSRVGSGHCLLPAEGLGCVCVCVFWGRGLLARPISSCMPQRPGPDGRDIRGCATSSKTDHPCGLMVLQRRYSRYLARGARA